MIPHDTEAEAAVIGACLMDRGIRDHAVGTLTVWSFYDVKHRAVWAALAYLAGSGSPVDTTTLAAEMERQKSLDNVGGRGFLLSLFALGSTVSAYRHIDIVADRATRRQLISLAESTDTQARDLSVEPAEIVATLERETESVRLPVESTSAPVDALELVSEPDDYEWMVPKLLERGDRVIWTAGEGVGKSTMQLQIAVTLASGVHPFSFYRLAPKRVLLVDFENSRRQLRRRLRSLLDHAGDRYAGGLGVVSRIEGADLRNPRDFRWLDALCEKHRPDLLVMGPLYKAFRVHGGEKKTDETAAEEAAYAIDRLRERHQMAVSLEAHSPHGHQGDREGYRPYGASLWLRWPEFGIGMKRLVTEPTVELVHWRGARDRDRDWPEALAQGVGGTWPWVALERERAA
jgi:replicative DNA helicase